MGKWLMFLIVVTLVILLTHATLSFEIQKPFPVLEAHPDTGDLYIPEETREVFGNVSFPISVVSVIGPYGSGKSFFLNKLLGMSCDEGFKVGSLHDKSRKGVWGVWIEMKIDGVQGIGLFLDTNAVDTVGYTELYDNRIFAIATVMSSVLIYNLPETIHETDLDRLSFTFELAQKSYGRVKGPDVPFEPMKLLWLIQREFLEGKSVQEVVHDALLSVPNHNGNTYINMVNQIRDSLAIMDINTTAFSLPQPHLERSRLCDLLDEELDPIYVKKIDQVRDLIRSIIQPKTLQRQPIHGEEFLSLLDQIFEVANKIEIPYYGSLVDVFNNAVLQHCLKLYADKMSALHLPILELEVRERYKFSLKEARFCFEEHHLGGSHLAAKLVLHLEEETNKVYRYILMENEYHSSTFCERSYSRCADKMGQIQLPSKKKVDDCFQQCEELFLRECMGPARDYYEQQMMKLLHRSCSPPLSLAEYHQRLRYVLVSVVLVVLVIIAVAILYIRQIRSIAAQRLLPLHRD